MGLAGTSSIKIMKFMGKINVFVKKRKGGV
jgi:hypothetical protein